MSTMDVRPVLVGHFEVASPAWHAARADGIGGSEITAVLGLSRYDSRFSLWHRKAGRLAPEVENNEMDAGKRLEPAICQKFADEHPELVGVPAGTYRHADRPWQIANPDRLLYTSQSEDAEPVAILEAKFALYDDDWGTEGTAEIPPYYLAQTRWYLDVFGLDTCYVEVFIGSSAEFRTYVVHADETDAITMRDAAAEFMRTLAADERPDIDAHSATYAAVREMHPAIDDVDVELDAELVKQYCSARVELKAAQDASTLATSLVADAIGDGRRGRYDGRTIVTRQARGDGLPYLVAGRSLPSFEDA